MVACRLIGSMICLFVAAAVVSAGSAHDQPLRTEAAAAEALATVLDGQSTMPARATTGARAAADQPRRPERTRSI
jgi:hypothetical protein